MKLILLTYFLMHSFKTLLFGSSNMFHSVVFDFSQYSVINANIQDVNSTTIEETSGLIGWTLFGLNPNGDDNATISYLYKKFYTNDVKNTTENSDLKIRSNNFTEEYNDNDLQETIEWFHNNRFMITLSCVTIFISLAFLGNLLLKLKPKKQNAIVSNGIRTLDGGLFTTKPKYFNPTFTSFVISILLTSYCNLATVIFWEFGILDSNGILEVLLVISITILVLIGFPIFVASLLFNKDIDLYNRKTMDNYGSLYLGFKQGSSSKFILLILLRQILYAIAINISLVFNNGQNSFILIINILFLVSIFWFDPYESEITKYQNIVLTSSLVIVSLINYYIISLDNHEAEIFWLAFSIGLQCLSFLVYFILLSIKYIRPLCVKDVIIRNFSTDKLNYTINRELETTSLIDSEPIDAVRHHNYVKKSSKRLVEEIELTNVDVS